MASKWFAVIDKTTGNHVSTVSEDSAGFASALETATDKGLEFVEITHQPGAGEVFDKDKKEVVTRAEPPRVDPLADLKDKASKDWTIEDVAAWLKLRG